MRLLVVRHGLAAERADHRGPDATRPLTPEGQRRTREAAAGLAALGLAPRLALTSPLLRARQTAAIVAAELGIDDLRETTALEPEAHPQDLLAELSRLPDLGDEDAVAVFGHLPHLDHLIAWAVHRDAPVFTSLKKAGAALLELTPRAGGGGARLAWLVEPRLLRALAGSR